jgi:hypothetical protein
VAANDVIGIVHNGLMEFTVSVALAF